MREIIQYDEFIDEYRLMIGNKASNIAILHQKGFNVPKGFALTHNYIDTIKSKKSSAKLERLFSILVPPLVVRSSAIDEDSKTKSYAGIFKTALNISSFSDFISAIEETIQSRSNEICMEYSSKKHSPMAVLVQQLVPAEYSGVVFTSNPVSLNPSEMVIEYFNGLGTSVVGGETTPQHLVFNKNSKQVILNVASSNGVAYYPQERGGCKKVYLFGDQVTYLADTMLYKIAEIASSVESLFGEPQDIEWSVVGDELYLLQSRPITSHIGI